MTRMRGPNAGDSIGMRTGSQPMTDFRPDRATRSFTGDFRAGALLACDDQYHPCIAADGRSQRCLQMPVGAVQTVTMQVDRHIRDQPTARDALFPTAIEKIRRAPGHPSRTIGFGWLGHC